MKLIDCDASDLLSWAKTPMAECVIAEISSMRDAALRNLIKRPTEQDAAAVRTYDNVLRIFSEARRER